MGHPSSRSNERQRKTGAPPLIGHLRTLHGYGDAVYHFAKDLLGLLGALEIG